MIGEPALAEFRGELVAAARREAARHHRRRLLLVVAATAVSISIAGAAIAAVAWLTGTPAPPVVVSDFGSYAPGLGFHPNPGKAVLVAHDGDISLYATTNQEGTYCTTVTAPWKPAATQPDGGSCLPASDASAPLTAGLGGEASNAGDGATLVVDGRVDNPLAQTLRFTDPDGRVITQPIGSSGFFVAAVPVEEPICNIGNWTTTLTALGNAGQELDQRTVTLWRGCVVIAPTTQP